MILTVGAVETVGQKQNYFLPFFYFGGVKTNFEALFWMLSLGNIFTMAFACKASHGNVATLRGDLIPLTEQTKTNMSAMVCIWSRVVDCLMIVSWLSLDCLMTVSWLPHDCLMTALWLSHDCLMTQKELLRIWWAMGLCRVGPFFLIILL